MYKIDYCGYNIHNPDSDIICRPNGSNSYLFLIIQSPMVFDFGIKRQEVTSGACILYTPGFPQWYQAVSDFYNSYIHFFTDVVIGDVFDFPVNEIFYPDKVDDIRWFLKALHREFLTKPIHYEAQINTLIHQMLIKTDRLSHRAGQQLIQNLSLQEEFNALRLRMLTYCEEDWTIMRLCKLLNLEKSQVYAYYKKFFNTSPKSELIQARIDKAKHLLSNEAIHINQVARMTGYADIYHFSRSFKQETGMSPLAYKRRINQQR